MNNSCEMLVRRRIFFQSQNAQSTGSTIHRSSSRGHWQSCRGFLSWHMPSGQCCQTCRCFRPSLQTWPQGNLLPCYSPAAAFYGFFGGVNHIAIYNGPSRWTGYVLSVVLNHGEPFLNEFRDGGDSPNLKACSPCGLKWPEMRQKSQAWRQTIFRWMAEVFVRSRPSKVEKADDTSRTWPIKRSLWQRKEPQQAHERGQERESPRNHARRQRRTRYVSNMWRLMPDLVDKFLILGVEHTPRASRL